MEVNDSHKNSDCNNDEASYREHFQYQIGKSDVFCTMCHKVLNALIKFKDNSLYAHPLLKVIICNNCKEEYSQKTRPTVCAWCCKKNILISCNNLKCDLLFCLQCVLNYSSDSQIESKCDWTCFNCSNRRLWKLRAETYYILNYVHQKSNKKKISFEPEKKFFTNQQLNELYDIFNTYITKMRNTSEKFKSNLNALYSNKIRKPFFNSHNNFLFCIAKVQTLHEHFQEKTIFIHKEFENSIKIWIKQNINYPINETLLKELCDNILKKNHLNSTICDKINDKQGEVLRGFNLDETLVTLNSNLQETLVPDCNDESNSEQSQQGINHSNENQKTQISSTENEVILSNTNNNDIDKIKSSNNIERVVATDESDTSSEDSFDVNHVSDFMSETENLRDSDSSFNKDYKNAIKTLLYDADSLSSSSISSSSEENDFEIKENGLPTTGKINDTGQCIEIKQCDRECNVALDSTIVSKYLENDELKKIQKLANIGNKRSRSSSDSSSGSTSKPAKLKKKKKKHSSQSSFDDGAESDMNMNDNSSGDLSSDENDDGDDFNLVLCDTSSDSLNSSISNTRKRKAKNKRKKHAVERNISSWKKDSLLTCSLNPQKPIEIFSDSSDDSIEARIDPNDIFFTKTKSNVILLDDSSNDSDESNLRIETSNVKPKKIRKVIPFHLLHESTKKAKKAEEERLLRLKSRDDEMKGIEAHSKAKTLVLEYNLKTKKPIIQVDLQLNAKLKPHQKEGIKFLWDSCFESIEQINNSPGNGSILAHCMGLGKTLQIITLLHTLFSYPECCVKRVLIIVPLSTLSNWIYEFKFWMKDLERKFKIFQLSKYREIQNTLILFQKWYQTGGIGIINYTGFQLLVQNYCSEENEDATFKEVLLNPGPDLVVFDEGHYLKNSKTKIYQSVSEIRTQRKVILTGTPMQNNLEEYYNMVNLVRPNLLGSRKEFTNRFINPITNGQHKNSSPSDIKLMQKRSHVLHKLLSGVVQRREESILKPYLPPLTHYIIYLKMSELQVKLYKSYIETAKKNPKIISDYQHLKKIWTHPLALHRAKRYTNEKTENEVETETWWFQICKLDDLNNLFSGTKLIILFSILKEAQSMGDKVVVFSSSLNILNCVEMFISNENPILEKMVKNENYLRIDGSTPKANRYNMCQCFNDTNNSNLSVLLATTKTCGLGLNLIGANRVVILDTPWNPADDLQSVFRIYRFGQVKSCYVYSLVALGTMEERIYEGSVTKQAVSCRVIDEQQIGRHFYRNNPQVFYNFFDPTDIERPSPSLPSDRILAAILMRHSGIIWSFHEHNNLLQNINAEELNEFERELAWEEFRIEESRLQIVSDAALMNQPSTSGTQRVEITIDENVMIIEP